MRDPRRRRRAAALAEVGVWGAALAAPLALPLGAAAGSILAGAALLVLLVRQRRPAGERWLVAGAFLACAATAASAVPAAPAALGPAWRERAGDAYAALWAELAGDAERVREALPPGFAASPDPTDPALRREAFRALAARHDRRSFGEREGGTVLLVDGDGEAVAWAGEGLLHELGPLDLPREGAAYVAGFGAVTLVAVAPVDASRRPWRVVAAESFTVDRLPFAGAEVSRRWVPVDRAEDAAPDSVVLAPPPGAPLGTPPLAIEVSAAPEPGEGRWRQGLWGLLAAALGGLAARRGGERFSRTGVRVGRGRVVGLAVAAAFAAGLSVAGLTAAGRAVSVALAAGAALAAAGIARRQRFTGSFTAAGWGAAAAGGAATALLVAVARGLQGLAGPGDLATGSVSEAVETALRIALALAVWGSWALVAKVAAPAREAADSWAWGAVALMAGAGAAHDGVAAALALLALGGFATVRWVAGGTALRSPSRLAVLAVLAALAAAAAWETAYRSRLRGDLATHLAARLAPPSAAELGDLETRVTRHFAALDPGRLLPRRPEGIATQDLAFVLWRDSPLARGNALSAVVVEPVAGPPSSFSSGLPLGEDQRIDWSSARWQELARVVGPGAVVQGQADLRSGGARWATVRFWLVPWPGFRLGGAASAGAPEVGLLRGGPAAGGRIAGLPDAVRFAFYDGAGRGLLSPWEDTPPLPEELAREARGTALVSTPEGRAEAFARRADDGWRVLYLPRLGSWRALERVAAQAWPALLAAALAAAAGLLLALPRTAFGELAGRAWRSYSRRLLVVYSALLLAPLVALNAVVVAAVEKRLSREQRSAGEAALVSAQRLVGDYLLALDPGFGLDTAFSDDLLAELSRVLRHEVNLYWGSTIYASSKPELFAAGLLPKRIPGDIFERLSLGGYELASRTNRVGGVSYLEIYSPLRVPGGPPGPGRLYLSMPLLAQQEEVARELANLRRQVVLASLVLAGLAWAAGARLARNFTTPLAELVAGTRRIAAGSPTLGMAPPAEQELAALVAAVDEMARRIAVGREELLRGKQLVERMVENITAGVVSLDPDRRVAMHNRVAADLLGTEVGEPLATALARRQRLAPVAEFVAEAGGEPARRTVRLAGGEDAVSGEGERDWNLVWVPLPGEGEQAALLVVEDATETLRGERLGAWAEMARIIAHEIKNPLTPIRLNVEHMRQVFRDRDSGRDFDRDRAGDRFSEVFDRCTGNVLTQVDELRQIASEFSTYSSILQLDREPGDLAAALVELVEPYRGAAPAGVAVELAVPAEGLPARFDRKLLTRAVRNLLENSLRAVGDVGGRVQLTLERVAGAGRPPEARIAVADSGPGVEPALLGRIFDPYFSTHDTGTGLGLPIARRVAEEHGGSIVARNRAEGGLEVTITIPIV